MKFVLFYQSLLSCWNHGNAHFLRGVVSELIERGHEVAVYEPADGWSLGNLLSQQGGAAVYDFHCAFPELNSHFYSAATLDLDTALERADVVIVHEWNEPELIARIGAHAARIGCKALFHDTHHRCVTDPASMAALNLRHYDGVLAFGATVADRYRRYGWARQAWVWHEAADLRRFQPRPSSGQKGDLIWIGNWGDDERNAELMEFLVEPVAQLGLQATVHGVRYPEHALHTLQRAGVHYGGWIANHRVPAAFAEFRCTVHVPRRAYTEHLRGIPTIRMFEALSCGIPLISAPWHDDEHLFRPGVDYLVAANGQQMQRHLRAVMNDDELAASLARHGLETIRDRHSCAHRVDELLEIVAAPDTGAQRYRKSAGMAEAARVSA
jgi:spore maturation protein CgeB